MRVSCVHRRFDAGDPAGSRSSAPDGDEHQIDGGFMCRVRQDEHVEVAHETVDDFIDVLVNGRPTLDDVGKPFQCVLSQIRERQLIQRFASKVRAEPGHEFGTVQANAEAFVAGNNVDQRQVAEDVPHLDRVDAIPGRHQMIAALVVPVLVKTAE